MALLLPTGVLMKHLIPHSAPMVNALTSPPTVNAMVNALNSPPTVNVMVNVLTSPPTVNALTTLKKTRINWGKGEHRDLLAKAIQDWLNEEGNAILSVIVVWSIAMRI